MCVYIYIFIQYIYTIYIQDTIAIISISQVFFHVHLIELILEYQGGV